MKKQFCVLKLYVNHRFMVQARVKTIEKSTQIERWKKRYALKHHNYEIYMYVESNFPNK